MASDKNKEYNYTFDETHIVSNRNFELVQNDEVDLLGVEDQDEKSTIHQNSEGWLVSYADLMTLLFGFFVIFYTIAKEQGDTAQKLKNFSIKTFGSSDKKLEAVSNLNQKSEEDILKEQAYINELKKYSEELYKKLQNSVNKEEYDRVKAERVELENKIKEMKLKLDNSVSNEEKNKILAELEALKSQLKNSNQEVESVGKNEVKIKNLENELKKIKMKEVQLEEKNTQLKALLENKPKNDFLMFVSKWGTEKHDIDLYVTDPNGREYFFKKRKFLNAPGELILDSRYGPGVELWQAAKFLKGKYKLRVILYNQYGNFNDAFVNITIVTNKGHLELPPTNLNQTKKEMIYFANVSEAGEISIEGF